MASVKHQTNEFKRNSQTCSEISLISYFKSECFLGVWCVHSKFKSCGVNDFISVHNLYNAISCNIIYFGSKVFLFL
jgi:hypothetical protein